jgi:hypothetical protein
MQQPRAGGIREFMIKNKTKTPESRILSDCLNTLRLLGIFHWRNSIGAIRVRPGQVIRFGMVGSSDIEGVLLDGRFLAVECKSPGGRLSPEQSAFLDKVRGLGGLALVVRSSRELLDGLRDAGYLTDPLFIPPC